MSSLHYYVRLTLFNGKTVSIDGNQLFALDSFSVDDQQTLRIGSQSSGAGAGKVIFDPLHLSLEQPALQPQLFQMLAAGTPFKEVDVLGYNNDGHLVEDYSFGTVAADQLSIDASGVTQVDLQYGAESIQHFTQLPDGSYPPTPDASAAWNAVQNRSGFPGGTLDPPLTLPSFYSDITPRLT